MMNVSMIVDEWACSGIDLMFNVGTVGSEYGVYDGHLRRTSTVEDAKDVLPQRKVLWSHFGISDVPVDGYDIGSVTLNTACGGMSPRVIWEAGLRMGAPRKPFCARFPTLDALHYASALAQDDITFLTQGWRNEGDLITITGEEQVHQILDAVRSVNGILFTGGISPTECERVVSMARASGITTVMSHPDQRHINMPVKVQDMCVQLGAWIQYTAALLFDGKKGAYDSKFIRAMVSRMKEWSERAFICSDVGRVSLKHEQYPHATPVEAIGWYAQVLTDHGLSLQTLDKLLLQNPRILIDERDNYDA